MFHKALLKWSLIVNHFCENCVFFHHFDIIIHKYEWTIDHFCLWQQVQLVEFVVVVSVQKGTKSKRQRTKLFLTCYLPCGRILSLLSDFLVDPKGVSRKCHQQHYHFRLWKLGTLYYLLLSSPARWLNPKLKFWHFLSQQKEKNWQLVPLFNNFLRFSSTHSSSLLFWLFLFSVNTVKFPFWRLLLYHFLFGFSKEQSFTWVI